MNILQKSEFRFQLYPSLSLTSSRLFLYLTLPRRDPLIRMKLNYATSLHLHLQPFCPRSWGSLSFQYFKMLLSHNPSKHSTFSLPG